MCQQNLQLASAPEKRQLFAFMRKGELPLLSQCVVTCAYIIYNERKYFFSLILCSLMQM